MADTGEVSEKEKGNDDGVKSGGTDPELERRTRSVERKSSRRSPTTGHVRRRKSVTKRSQSSPREVTSLGIEATSSDDEARRAEARKRTSPSPALEPKKVLRKRHRLKEKCLDAASLPQKTESSVVENDVVQKDVSNSKLEIVQKIEKEATLKENDIQQNQQTELCSNLKSDEIKEKSSDLDPTTDDETAAEFVKLLSKTTKSSILKSKSKQLSVDSDNSKFIPKQSFFKSLFCLVKQSRSEFVTYRKTVPKEVETLRRLRNRCLCEFMLMFIFCGCGAFLFKTTEGAFESYYKCGVKRVKRDFIDDLWRSSHFMKEDEWKSKARRRLWEFENQLHEAFDAGMTSYSGQRAWSFVNGIIYCLTVVTTIGYGHIAPVTNSGRALTIAYSIIGIPLFLILLADFGKLFTRGIKFLWAFVRRLYYTGSCRTVRRTAPVQEVMKGMQLVYDSIRRPSMFTPDGNMKEGGGAGEMGPVTPLGDPPSTPALSVFAIDDEFNLPISVAISVLLVYIFLGATVFWVWEEDWSFFEAFYFVFISMSTIGFGDLVPKNQMYMMASIVYLAFGLALTSMCINVVQEKLSDTFRKASAKIGATIGLKVSDEDGTISPVSPTQVEIAEVHKPTSLNLPPQVP